MSDAACATFPPDPLPPVILGSTINLLAAAPGTGKSTFLAWFSRHVRDRTPLWGREWGEIPWQGIICSDRSWARSTSKWFEIEGVELPAYSLQDDRSFKKARLRHRHQRVAVFEHCLNALSPSQDGRFPFGSLIYVDPIALFLGGNLLDYDTCAVACSELREICMDRGVTVIGTAHSAKQKADKRERYLRLQDRILGSTALFGYTDTQMFLASPEEMGLEHYTFLWHPHHAPPALFQFTRHPDTGGFVEGSQIVDGAPTPASIPVQPVEAPDWLLCAFDTGPRPFIELMVLAESQGWSRATLHRKLLGLEAQGVVAKVRRGVYERPTH